MSHALGRGKAEYWPFVGAAGAVVLFVNPGAHIGGGRNEQKAEGRCDGLTLAQRPKGPAISRRNLAEIAANGADAPGDLLRPGVGAIYYADGAVACRAGRRQGELRKVSSN